MTELPTGTVTFLFTDIEGSTRLLDEMGDRYADVLAEHHRLMRTAFEPLGGVEVDTAGDAFFVAFERPSDAVAAAAAAQEALAPTGLRVRMGIHTGKPLLTQTGYVGMDVHRAARIMSAGHGGQVLVSDETRALLHGDARLVDVGAHRLKDLTEPQRLWQLGASDFPPLKTLFKSNLPVQPTDLVGREAELSQVFGLLRKSRLVTVTGAGGSGKTRLALQAAAELVDEFKDGVWWVSLAALRDSDLVEPEVAQVVGAKEGLVEHLRWKQTLLLLDNFEHLLDAAPLIAAILAEAPDLRVLATSRERLGLSGEHEYSIPTMVADEAIALFTTRARQLRPAFEPDDATAEICRRLDGLPLAIELAAARIKLLRADQILERLGRALDVLAAGSRDAPERQRTLRATIEWSYELLTDAERLTFMRLAVFAGSFSAEAAEVVCDADLDTLSALVDKSLLRQTDDGRLFVLETIREYAAERLDGEKDAGVVRAQHTRWCVELATERDPQDADVERLDELERDLDNFRAALEWSLSAGDAADALEIAVALSRLWEMRGYWAEAIAWYERVAVAPGVPALLRGRALIEHAAVATHLDDWDRVRLLVEEARAPMLASGDPRDRGRWWLLAGGIAWMGEGDAKAGVEALERGLAELREAGDVAGERVITHHLGEASRERRDFQRSVEWLERSIELSRTLGDLMFEAASLHGLGDTWFELGDDARSEEAYRDSLRASHAARFDGQTVLCLAALSATAARRGDIDRAASLWATVEAFERDRGAPLHEHERRRYVAVLAGIPAAAPLPLDEAVVRGLSLD